MQDDEMQSAYRELGLAPGSPWDEIEEKFKFLVMSFHPDRASAKNKELASESLKKVNHARDILKAHFKSSEHDDSPYCRCRRTNEPSSAATSKSTNSPGGASSGASGAASSAASNGATSDTSSGTSKSASQSKGTSQADASAKPDTPPPASKPLRQPKSTTPTPNPFAKLTAKQKTIGLASIAVLLVWGHFDHQAQDEREARDKAAEEARAKAEYDSRPHYKWVPGQAEAQAKEAQEAEIKERANQAAAEQYQRKLTRAREDVDRYQKSIAQNEKNIAALKASLADSNLTTTDKQSLSAELAMRTKDLTANRDSLEAARQALDEILQGAPPISNR